MLLSLLIEQMKATGILTDVEAASVKDLYTLTLVLEGKHDSLFGDAARNYIKTVRSLLDEGMLDSVEHIDPPSKMKAFHETLLHAIPKIRERFDSK